jgi:hypothetical protein
VNKAKGISEGGYVRPEAHKHSATSSTYLSSPLERAEEESSTSPWRRLGRCCTAVCACTDCRDILGPAAQLEEKENPRGVVRGKGIDYSLEEYVNKAQEHVKEQRKASGKAQREKLKKDETLVSKDIYKMFLDVSAPYSVRLHYLECFLDLDGENQHRVLRAWIGLQFSAIYTMTRSALTCLGLFTIFLLPSLPLASVVLFAKNDKDGYDKRDITVTYILLFGTAVMELAPLFITIWAYPCFDVIY